MLPAIARRSSRLVFDSPFDLLNAELGRMLSRWWTDQDGDLVGAYPVDVREDADHLYVDAELPGFKKDQINVTLEKGLLHITAEREAEQAQGEAHLVERRFNRVARSFTLPAPVDESKVEARLENGVLHLILNKRDEVKPRRIEVK